MSAIKSSAPLSESLRTFLEWHAANEQATPEALWNAYDSQLLAAWEPFSAGWLSLRIAPQYRATLSEVCARLGAMRLWYFPTPTIEEAEVEAKLWEIARALDPRKMARRSWNEEKSGYLSPAHRLADLYRRTGRHDADAVALFIELHGAPFPTEGVDVHRLIYKGAHITTEDPPAVAQVRVRLGLCYRLRLQSFPAPWVQSSIEKGEARIRQLRIKGAVKSKQLKA